MGEWKLWHGSNPPEWTTPEWYGERPSAHHLEEGIHRGRLFAAADFVHSARQLGYGPKVVDLGAGDGGLISMINTAEVKCWGYDLQPSNVDYAHHIRQVDVRYGNALEDEIEWADIAVCTEMLEHLVDPHGFVKKISEHSRALVASSPANETSASHYAFHTWAWDAEGYYDLMEQGGFKVVRSRSVDYWTVVLAVRP
jgi:2-polyprenyl-3-methyl-5-hydroxy-6-metoxy-1,4-benzoquinol methylase